MVSIKIRLRRSAVAGRPGTIFYQVIKDRIVRRVKTEYKVYESEWDSETSEIVASCCGDRYIVLQDIRNLIHRDILLFNRIVNSFDKCENQYSSDDIVSAFLSQYECRCTVFGYMEEAIVKMKRIGKDRTAETYQAALRSFRHFRCGYDMPLDRLDSAMMLDFEAYLSRRGVTPNSSSFYMRNIRAMYNKAVKDGVVQQCFPFKYVYTGVDKTLKRAVPINTIRLIKSIDLSGSPSQDFARDMFLFSFYTRGMSFIDMAFLKKKDLVDGFLVYRRRKTGHRLSIKWERQMQEIVDKYEMTESFYLLPIICRSDLEEREQYIYAGYKINRSLKLIGSRLGLHMPLTMYVARHSWASIAKSKNIPVSVISEGMGHDSEKTTRIYLASLDSLAIDRANSKILKSI